MQENIAIQEINVRKEIAQAQAQVLAAAMQNAKIDIVGGETEFFNNLVNAVMEGKTKNALVQSNAVLTELKDALLQPGEDNLVLKVKKLLENAGVSSETVKNLSLSAMLAKLSGSTQDAAVLNQIGAVKQLVERYGLGDLIVNLSGK